MGFSSPLTTAGAISYLLFIVLFASSYTVRAQDHDPHGEESAHHALYKHSIALFVGYTFIPNSVESNESQTYVAPTIGVDYLYKFNHKFAISLKSDIELASYEVEREHEESLKREYAFVSTLVFVYEPIHWWSVFAGPGFEYEHHESFYVTRLGTEFIKRFQDGWSLALTMTVDIKEVNTTPAIGITILKGLGSPE